MHAMVYRYNYRRYRYRGFRATYPMDSHCGPLCFSESGPTDSHCGLKLYCTVLRYCMVPVHMYHYRYRYHLRYSRAKSGAADSDCGVKLGAENSLSGLKHCVSSSKTSMAAEASARFFLTPILSL